MTTRKTALLLTILIMVFGATWIGCSDSEEFVTKYDPTNTGDGGAISSEVTYYFPLYEGYKTVYRVIEGDTEYPESFTVGRVVYKTTGTYLPWISYSPGRGADTGYFQVNTSELFYFERIGVAAERILALPLTIGATWDRTTSLSTGGDDVIIIDEQDAGDPIVDTVDYGGYIAKNFPSTGEGTMEVVATESVTLTTGESFSGSVKIVNRNTDGTYNQYWYAPGIGLVKYILGSPSTISLSGTKSAEITSYDRR